MGPLKDVYTKSRILSTIGKATLRIAMAAMADPNAGATEVAKRLNMTTTTLYTYVNGDGTVKEVGHKLFLDS